MGEFELPVLPDIADLEVPEFPIKWVFAALLIPTTWTLSTQILSYSLEMNDFCSIIVQMFIPFLNIFVIITWSSWSKAFNYQKSKSKEEEDEERERADGGLNRGTAKHGLETPQFGKPQVRS